MRRRLLFDLGRVLAACLLASLPASSQSRHAPRAERETTARPAAVSRLVVQVEASDDKPPAYQPVPGGGWFGFLPATGPPRLRTPTEETARAVDVRSRETGEGRVEITVGVHLGVTRFERFEEVGKYDVAVGERVAALGLRRFGVAPFRFRVLRVNDADAAPPAVVNRTQSVEAAVTDFAPAPLPRGRLTLRNLSAKPVRAVRVTMLVGGKNRGMGFVADKEGRTLVEPGAAVEWPFVARTGESDGPAFTPAGVESIVVETVVFDDYSYEGEVEHAALRRAFAEGQRAQLPRLIALVREAQAATDADPRDAARRLRERVASLADDPPQWAVDAVLDSYTGLEFLGPGRWRSPIKTAMHSTRRGLLEDLEQFEKRHAESPAGNGFNLWLERKRLSFEAWLARL